MDEFFLNEHSLHGQYWDARSFLVALRMIMSARTAIEGAGFRIWCDSSIRFRSAVGDITLEQCLQAIGNRELRNSVLAWLSKSGPFWAAAPFHSSNDLFACLNDDVAGTSLAEAACRQSLENPSCLYGFDSNKWNKTPLLVTWTFATGEVDVNIDNIWDNKLLEARLRTIEKPIENWLDLLLWAKQNCKHILFSKDVFEPILSEPFSFAAANEIQMLINILEEMSKNHDVNGALTSQGLILHDIYFRGHHSRFSDETHNAAFVFTHPLRGEQVVCSWHGKVRLGRQYRLHFEWPKPAGELLWISYIGPKLTKG